MAYTLIDLAGTGLDIGPLATSNIERALQASERAFTAAESAGGYWPVSQPIMPGVAMGAGAGIVGPVIETVATGMAAKEVWDIAWGEQPFQQQPGTQYGIPFVGPGLREPHKDYLLKEWHLTLMGAHCQFYLTENARGQKRIWCYNTEKGTWKSWALPKLAVIGKNMPSHKMLARLRHNLKRHTDDAKTILSITSPAYYATMHGYHKQKHYHRRGR
jgi:hypothetical protein